jgi:hypothetical protein
LFAKVIIILLFIFSEKRAGIAENSRKKHIVKLNNRAFLTVNGEGLRLKQVNLLLEFQNSERCLIATFQQTNK